MKIRINKVFFWGYRSKFDPPVILYLPRRLVTSIILLLFAIGALFWENQKQAVRLEQERRENLSFSKQIDQLNSTEENLKELITFIESQKTQLRRSQDALNSLNEEKEQLEPIVQADRETIEAILDFQARRKRTNVWIERGIGFGLGVLSSIIATSIWTIGSILWRNKMNLPEQPEQPND
ncbi:MAG: hypothetical protein AAGG51_09965 [Cyanobacteria bacterium P01_G01_bin.54]